VRAVGGVDDAFASRIERHRSKRRPVASAAGPARWIALLGLEVQGVPCGQDGLVLAGVALRRADVPDAAVTMIVVVPTHELRRPDPGFSEIGRTGQVGIAAMPSASAVRRARCTAWERIGRWAHSVRLR
jgi:hypothetical protein